MPSTVRILVYRVVVVGDVKRYSNSLLVETDPQTRCRHVTIYANKDKEIDD